MAVRNLAKNLVNHTGFVVDASGSTQKISNAIDKSIREQTDSLSDLSLNTDQETRGTLYLFDDEIECLYYDMDVLRLREKFKATTKIHKVGGMTRLVGATLQAIRDLEKSATLYGDHAFLLYVWTDGLENESHADELRDFPVKMRALPDNWTVVALVPDEQAKAQAIHYGFPENNVALWTTTIEGLKTAQTQVQQATEHYFVSRAAGIRGTNNFFELNLNISKEDAAQNLIALPVEKFKIFKITNKERIDHFVKAKVGHYKPGMAFYHFTNSEDIRPKNQIILRNKQSGEYFTGPGARAMVGLPDRTVTFHPKKHPEWDVFVESTSYTRQTDPGTDLLVFPQ